MSESHIPEDPKRLMGFLDEIEQESDRVMVGFPARWKQAACLYKTGAATVQDRQPYPLFNANVIRPTVLTGSALVTETKPACDVKPWRKGLWETSRMLSQCFAALWDMHDIQARLEKLQRTTDTFNASMLYIGWDPEALHGMGGLEIDVKDPRQMKVDGALRDPEQIDTAQYIIDRTVNPLANVAHAFPDIADRLRPTGILTPIEDQVQDQPKGVMARIRTIYGGSGSGANRTMTGSYDAIPRVLLRTYWLRDPARDEDDHPLYPGGRLVIRANDDVICEPDPKKQLNPYYDGGWPYEWLDGIPDPDSPWGRSEIEAIQAIQNVFNLIGNAGTKSILRESPSWVIYDDGAITNQRSMDHLTELGFRLVPKRRGFDFRHDGPAVSTQSYTTWLSYCQGLIEYLTGVRDSGGGVGGKGRAEVRSPELLEGLQKAQQVLIRAKARRMERLLSRAGQKIISRIFQFFTMDRLMHTVGDDGAWHTVEFERAKFTSETLALALRRAQDARQIERMKAAEHGEDVSLLPEIGELDSDEILLAIKGASKDFALRVEPYSSLSTTRMAKAQELMQLHGIGGAPSYMVGEALGFGNAKEMRSKWVEEAKENAALGLPQPQAPQQKGKRGSKGGQSK
jgi:hypothetical protein